MSLFPSYRPYSRHIGACRLGSTRLEFEQLEGRRLLAVDLLSEVVLDEGAIFRPRDLVGYQGQILFRGDDGFFGPETWISSGDPSDVQLLKDIQTGQGGSGPRDFTEYQGRLFFAATNGGNGYELWVTQGTKASTQLMGDIWAGRESGVPTELTVFNDLMYFFANDGEIGRELYRSDGTPAGTFAIADFIPGRSGLSGEEMTVVGDRMFFDSDTSAPGLAGLWVTDGTQEGTNRIEVAGLSAAPIDLLTPFGDRLLFANGSRVYVTDGTVEGTARLPVVDSNDGELADGGTVTGIEVLNDSVFVTHADSSFARVYSGDLQQGDLLADADGVKVAAGRVYHWSSRGVFVREASGESTRLVSFNSFFGTQMTNTSVHENGLVFAVNRTLDRYEIWATNGTSAGTEMVDQVTDNSSSPLLGFQLVDDAIYFAATNGNPRESLWKVDAPTIEAVDPPMPPALVGDTNADLLVDSLDVDAVFAAAKSNSNDLLFDVNGDGAVAASDGAYIVENVLGSKVGDLDLNGRVEFADFLVLSTNFGKSASYAEGDADGDGVVGFADFLLMSTNFGFQRN